MLKRALVGSSFFLVFGIAQLASAQSAIPDVNSAWNEIVSAATDAAISGPDMLRAAKIGQQAFLAYSQAQQQKLAAAQKTLAEMQSKLAAMTKERDAALARPSVACGASSPSIRTYLTSPSKQKH
jgi:hypothetical protein